VYEGKDPGSVKADKLAARLESLGPGLWLHIDHAATDDPEMRAIGHPGYEWVAADRRAVFEAWTSPKVREVITRRGIKLTSYRDLINKPQDDPLVTTGRPRGQLRRGRRSRVPVKGQPLPSIPRFIACSSRMAAL
jgi:hypothetical protein